MKILRTKRLHMIVALVVGLALTVRGDDATKAPNGNQVVMLRATVKMLTSSVEAKNERIGELQAEIKKLNRELERLRALCKKANIDTSEPALPMKGARTRPKPPVASSLVAVLRLIPKRLLPGEGPLTNLQRSALNAWLAQHVQGESIIVTVHMQSVEEIHQGIRLRGYLTGTGGFDNRWSRVSATFPLAQRSKLLKVSSGDTVTLRGSAEKVTGGGWYSAGRKWNWCAELTGCRLVSVSNPKANPTGQSTLPPRRSGDRHGGRKDR